MSLFFFAKAALYLCIFKSSVMSSEKGHQFAKTYAEICKVPAVSGGFFTPVPEGQNPGSLPVSISLSQRDVVSAKKRITMTNYIWNGKSYSSGGFPSEMGDCACLTLSPSRRRLACVRYLDAEKTKTSIQVWSLNSLELSVPTSIAKHGALYTENIIGGLSWSPDESSIAYVAEKKTPENESYYFPSCESNKNCTRGKEFEFTSDWGELYSGKKKSEVFVVDLKESSIKHVKGIPDDIMPGQVQWTSDSKNLIFTGWKINDGIKLGFVYCFNRESYLYQIDVNGAGEDDDEDQERAICITPDDSRARSPRVSADGQNVIYLSTRKVLSHNTCCKLMQLDLKSRKIKCIVDVVEESSGHEFPGIYCISLPKQCFSKDGKNILVESGWRSNQAAIKVCLSTGAVKRFPGFSRVAKASFFLLDVYDKYALCYCSSPNHPYSILVLDLESWAYTEVSTLVLDSKYQFEWEIEKVTPLDCGKASHVYEAIVMKSKSAGPFIAMPHGGPHGACLASFNTNLTFFVSLGFSVIQLNYRGSTGFGLEPLESLLGKCGSQDVHDCQNAVTLLAKTYNLDSKRAFVMGGSHGGFLTCHLIAQFPHYYKAAVAHNPVTDFPAAVRTSDIPDWVFAEALNSELKPYPTQSDLTIMLSKSPISMVSNIETPLMLKIGQKDVRVHPSQGFAFYRCLKSLGAPVTLYLFPDDSHPIDSVGPESDSYINMALWFTKHDRRNSLY